MFEAKYYIVKRIDGDYAYLIIEDMPELEEKRVARALLSSAIEEGSRLKYEMMSYSICE